MPNMHVISCILMCPRAVYRMPDVSYASCFTTCMTYMYARVNAVSGFTEIFISL